MSRDTYLIARIDPQTGTVLYSTFGAPDRSWTVHKFDATNWSNRRQAIRIARILARQRPGFVYRVAYTAGHQIVWSAPA